MTIRSPGITFSSYKLVWHNLDNPHISFVLWLAILDSLDSKNKAAIYGPSIDKMCLLCDDLEDMDHLSSAYDYLEESSSLSWIVNLGMDGLSGSTKSGWVMEL